MTRIVNAKQLQRKSLNCLVNAYGNVYTVLSPSGVQYTVKPVAVQPGQIGATCTCPWGEHRPASDPRSACAHVLAVFRYIEARRGRRVSVWCDYEQAKRQHNPVIFIGDGVVLTSAIASEAYKGGVNQRWPWGF